MTRNMLHVILAVAITAILAGCAVYPAVQVAGHAMTGYDAVNLADEYLPRKSVQGGERCINSDRVLQRRLRERLLLNHITVSAHVINANAYLVGSVMGRTQADAAIDTAATVKGLRTITCKFYHAPTAEQTGEAIELHAELTGRLERIKRLEGADLRIEVIGTNAVLIGCTDTYGQKSEALAVASEIGGITDIVDYITVKEKLPDEQAEGEEVASN